MATATVESVSAEPPHPFTSILLSDINAVNLANSSSSSLHSIKLTRSLSISSHQQQDNLNLNLPIEFPTEVSLAVEFLSDSNNLNNNEVVRDNEIRLEDVPEKMRRVLQKLTRYAQKKSSIESINFKESYHKYVLTPILSIWLDEARRSSYFPSNIVTTTTTTENENENDGSSNNNNNSSSSEGGGVSSSSSNNTNESQCGDVRFTVDVSVICQALSQLLSQYMSQLPPSEMDDDDDDDDDNEDGNNSDDSDSNASSTNGGYHVRRVSFLMDNADPIELEYQQRRQENPSENNNTVTIPPPPLPSTCVDDIVQEEDDNNNNHPHQNDYPDENHHTNHLRQLLPRVNSLHRCHHHNNNSSSNKLLLHRNDSFASVGAFTCGSNDIYYEINQNASSSSSQQQQQQIHRNKPVFSPFTLRNTSPLKPLNVVRFADVDGNDNNVDHQKPSTSSTTTTQAKAPEVVMATKVIPLETTISSPDRDVVDIIEKLLSISPVDLLIIILKNTEIFLPTIVGDKIKHLYECSLDDKQMQTFYDNGIRDGEFHQNLLKTWIKEPGKKECAICYDNSIPCSQRLCCHQLICEPCLLQYIQSKVNDGHTEIFCPCQKDCRGIIYRSDILTRLNRQLREKFSRFLDQANQTARKKTCPRCSHLTELSVSEERRLYKGRHHQQQSPQQQQQQQQQQQHSHSSGKLLQRFFRSKRGRNSHNNGVSNNISYSPDHASGSSHLSKMSKHAFERHMGGLCLTCEYCKLLWCFRCHAPSHAGLSCKEWRKGDILVKEWAQKPSETTIRDTQLDFIEIPNNLLVKDVTRKARKCPKCGIFIERTEGCAHMICSECDAKWCYDCGGRRLHIPYVGNHDSKYSVLGCPRRLLPHQPYLRRFIRGGLLALILLSTPVVVVLVVGVGAVALPIGGAAYGIFRVYRHIRYRY